MDEIRLTSWGWWFIPLFTGFIHPRWCRISSINTTSTNLGVSEKFVNWPALPPPPFVSPSTWHRHAAPEAKANKTMSNVKHLPYQKLTLRTWKNDGWKIAPEKMMVGRRSGFLLGPDVCGGAFAVSLREGKRQQVERWKAVEGFLGSFQVAEKRWQFFWNWNYHFGPPKPTFLEAFYDR